MNITEILTKESVCVPLKATEKTSAILELVDRLHANNMLQDRDDVLRAVMVREETRSTGIGLGLAVPHGKSAGCRNLVMSVGKPAAPIDFGSPDGRPCSFIVLLASPLDKTGPHIQALASISRMWKAEDFRIAVMKSETADDLYAAIERQG
ncbi:MAG: PTS sugar transporter subunit IIA [Phycisphaerales bacterium]|nr:MAG: PTS sugar transporter subunit IIA [Phycisphaerales bacterium]